MGKRFWIVLLALGALAGAQTTPTLSTADKMALQQCETAKRDAQAAEDRIVKEWQDAHPGFTINSSKGFAIEPVGQKPVPAVR